MPHLLIVDDEPNVLYSFERALADDHVRVASVQTGGDAVRYVKQSPPDAVVLDVRLPDMSGLEAFEQMQEFDPRLPVIFVTAHSTAETAIDAMKRGAFEYLLKPVDIHELRELVAKALDISRQRHVPAVFGEESLIAEGPADRIIGDSRPMREVYKAIGRVATKDVSVLILGESGTGKELVARALYHHSARSDRPFLAINCAALPDALLESELFGHERGAFTGAERRRIGKFEQAHQGTLFLDEIGDMNPTTQAKVLRVLQDGRFERVGGDRTIDTDVRVIAATNQPLEDKIEAGEFRQDLLYRLNGFTIRLPPLRERIEDLPQLIEYCLQRQASEESLPVTVDEEAMVLMEQHTWPGNVRELHSTIQYAVMHAVGQIITPDCLPEAVRIGGAESSAAESVEELADVTRLVRQLLEADPENLFREVRNRVDRIALEETMRHVQGNQVHASQKLGISRSTLRAKLAELEDGNEP